jgi:hypothetical protein
MPVTLDRDVLVRYRRFTLYNSPFVAHDRGHAVDLYPPAGATVASSPVAGEVVGTRTVAAPPQPYAADEDHLVLVDTGDRVARLLHVDPSVEAGETVDVGDPLGELVRAGFFAPWVPNHVHLGFRAPDANPYRASGSLPVALDPSLDLRPVSWDGTGTVVEAGDTWALLDEPIHPAPGEAFAGIESEAGVLDGGLPHYEGGGLLGGHRSGTVDLLGTTVGTVEGRDVTWADCEIRANGTPVRGIALYCARDRLGAKVVGRDVDLAEGETVEVSVRT